ncbi:MAG: GGDEF domain-containing protein, partial [Acidimicrobiia bacterium]
LLNRRSLENRVRDLVANGTSYVVAYGDLDQFKDLNDTHGHEAGDRSLRLFARVLRDSIRPVDIPARFGGEEFLIVLPDCSLEDATAVMERVREQLALALASGAVPGFTVSFGVAPGDPRTRFDEVVAHADSALYAAKQSGRNRVVAANETTEPDGAPHADVH